MSQNTFTDRLKHAWNVFRSKEDADQTSFFTDIMTYGGSSYRVDRTTLKPTLERSIIASLYTKIAIDVSAIPIKHVRIDENDRYVETIKSDLNNCLSVEANLDQTGREFIHDCVLSLLDEGHIAIVPVDTTMDIRKSNSFDIQSMRVGKITHWYPLDVKIEVYNEKIGSKQEIVLPKNKVGIIENPFYSVMNEPNSTLKRLIDKLNLLDSIDKQSGSSKLDLIIQLPYAIKSPARKKQAEERKKAIEEQLFNSKYGIAYTDATEHVTQLNRSVENNLMGQIEYLTTTLYSQLGISQEVFNGTADEKATLNYYNSTIEPIISAITNEMNRKFLTKTARSQGQSIMFIRDPFRLVPVGDIAEMADKFTRNEIATSNEIRSLVGFMPIDDERADQLINSNLNQPENYEEYVEDEDLLMEETDEV